MSQNSPISFSSGSDRCHLNLLRALKSASAAMWRDLFVLCLSTAILASPMSQGYKDDGYGDQGGQGGAGYGEKAESYTKDDGYGSKVVCTPTYDMVYKELCESYFDRVCRTTHQEKCVEVDEVVCELREDVKYQTVQVGFTVQKCSKVT